MYLQGLFIYLHTQKHNMKQLLAIAIVLLTFGCNKKTSTYTPPNTPSTPNNPNPSYWWKFIPNWYNGDTLIGDIYDTVGGLHLAGQDTIYTFASSGQLDTSFIVHNGVKYYVWTAKYFINTPNDTFTPDEMGYVNVFVNTSVDTNNAISYGLFSQADPHKYKDNNGNWKKQKQRLTISSIGVSQFKANNILMDGFGTYMSKVVR